MNKIKGGRSVELLVTFETVSAALEGEIITRELGVPCRIIPVPRTLSSSCGYALSAEAGDAAGFCEGLRRRGASFVRVFRCGDAPEKGGTYEVLAGPDGGLDRDRGWGGAEC
jgi:hypothetical protein